MKHRFLTAVLALTMGLGLVLPTSAKTTVTPDPQVKKSTTNICHSKGSQYYKQTKKFTPYKTLKDCLKSGGRLPK